MRCSFGTSCARLMLALSTLVGGRSAPLVAQETQDAGPRFLLAAVTRGSVPAVADISRVPLLRRRVTLELTDVPLKQALTALGREARVAFVYNLEALPAERRVSVRAAGMTVAAVLTDMLLDARLDVLLSGSDRLTLVPRQVPAAGTIVGRVSDAKTQAVLAGATVVVQDTSRSATCGSDGRYHIADVTPGTYTLRARYIGYAPGSLSVSVTADQEATADFALEKSVQRLDEVVTTGTVVPTEVKALPTPISVITGEEIEQKGYQRIDQIFRGDVPGAIAWDNGAYGTSYSDISIRGASDISQSYVKTYIDGVEVADPVSLATIDPSSIERIEVLRGPQGSTIYGSDAAGGVMQIFTRKGTLNAPYTHVEAKVSAGLTESPWASGAKLGQDHSLAVAGGTRDFSYRLGGGYAHQGEWVPGYYANDATLNGGLRGTQGPVTVELSARYYGRTYGYPLDPRLQNAGYTYYSKPFDQTTAFRQQTYGVNFNYRAARGWEHTVVLGYDRSGYDDYYNHPRFTTPADSFLYVQSLDENKASLAYNTRYTMSIGRAVQLSITAGADHWRYYRDGFYAGTATTNANTIPNPNFGSRYQYDNTGYFAQEQLGLWDALFVTAGLRAEDNQNFGADFGLAWAPRVGISYVHSFGNVTAKVRGAYGKGIRPPTAGAAVGLMTAFVRQLPNTNLGPQSQVGPDGGLELYFGGRASLEATYYHQTAKDLIDQVVQGFSPVYTYQYQNVGRIKNTGWEFQGRLNGGRFSLTGTYSVFSSLVEQLSPTYSGDLRPGDPMLAIPEHSAGATLSYSLPRTTIVLGMTNVDSWTSYDYLALFGVYYGGQPYRGSFRNYWTTYPGFTKFNLSMSQAVTGHLSVFIRSDNLTNNHAYERSNLTLNPGRSTMLGVRTRF